MPHLKKNQYFEQNVTLFGMKKKKKLNQIPIFKLWYIGQIYIIPKLIKEMIEKKQQKKQKKKQ